MTTREARDKTLRVYLHLADTGLLLSDLSLRIYDGDDSVSASEVTMETYGSSGTDYYLDNVPEPDVSGLTLTFETPLGVYHAYRYGVAETQPLNVIIPIREVFDDPVNDLSIRLFKNDLETTPDVDNVVQLNSDGEYSVSGWLSTPMGEQWSLRWIYNGQVYSHRWTGTTRSSMSIPYTTVFQEIRAIQSPFSYRVDGLNRVMFSCNYLVRTVAPSRNFEDGIEQILRDAGKVASDELLYIGPRETWPDNDGPFFVLIATGGNEPDETHDTKRENLGLQIITTATDYEVARERAFDVYNYLDGLRSVSVTL